MRQAILVTGADGFVGSAVVDRLRRDEVPVRCAVRKRKFTSSEGVPVFEVGDISGSTDWRASVEGVSAVVHCAARVHHVSDSVDDALAEYLTVNRDGTKALAEQASAAGVKRLVFLSSIKVNGDSTAAGRPFRADDAAAPSDAYGVSKWEAEQALRLVEAATGIEVVIIRPPLVYGPGVKANFRSMMDNVDRAWPMPFGAIRNRRSLVALANLVDLIVVAVTHPKALGKTFLVSDDEPLSTSDLLRRTARALGRPSRLLPIPESMLSAAMTLVGRRDLALRLCGSLELDIADTRRILGWRPPIGVDQALVDAAQHHLAIKIAKVLPGE